MPTNSIEELIKHFSTLPGIGPKTAQRLTYHILAEKERCKGLQLAQSLTKTLTNIRQCDKCNTYTETPLCAICQDPKRQQDTLCIIETPMDIAAIEQTHTYHGIYFVLNGCLSPLDGIGPAEIQLPKLFTLLDKTPQIKELIIATNPTMEGKATAHYIANHLKNKPIQCTRIAFGVPIGGEIEYLDGHTLAHALSSRKIFSQPIHEQSNQ